MQIKIGIKITIKLVNILEKNNLSEHSNSVSEHQNFKIPGVAFFQSPTPPLAARILGGHVICQL